MRDIFSYKLTNRAKISLTIKSKLAHCPIYQKATDKLNIDKERKREEKDGKI